MDNKQKIGTILIVEDNISINNMIKNVLNHYNYEIFQAYDGMEAIKIIENNKSSIDLILIDLQLPLIDGWEVIKRVKKDFNTNRLPIIVISAHAMQKDIDRAYEEGCYKYITKPLEIKSFINDIDEYFKNLQD